MRLLFIGDVVGQSGCEFLSRKLSSFKKLKGIDVCIVNGENAAQGNGATPHSCEMLFNAGADLITLGNHAFKRPEIADYLDSNVPIVRPYNFPEGAPGRGVDIIDKGRIRVAVINILGTVYSEPVTNPFWAIKEALRELDGCKTVIVDFHAEATSEKRAMGFYLDGEVTAVLGTHTHVQTADNQLLPKGTAYITDVGMTGAVQSVLGIKPSIIIKKLKTNLPTRFENGADGDDDEFMMNACILEIDEKTGKALGIERVDLR